jgi:hypothetical protein
LIIEEDPREKRTPWELPPRGVLHEFGMVADDADVATIERWKGKHPEFCGS